MTHDEERMRDARAMIRGIAGNNDTPLHERLLLVSQLTTVCMDQMRMLEVAIKAQSALARLNEIKP